MVTIADLIKYRTRNNRSSSVVASAKLPTDYGDDWRVHVFVNQLDKSEHVALVCGDIFRRQKCCVRRALFLSDGRRAPFARCDCGMHATPQ